MLLEVDPIIRGPVWPSAQVSVLTVWPSTRGPTGHPVVCEGPGPKVRQSVINYVMWNENPRIGYQVACGRDHDPTHLPFSPFSAC